jgi:hypothetical protein
VKSDTSDGQVHAPFHQSRASNRHMKVVRLPALRTDRLYPKEGLLVLISVKRLSRPQGHNATGRIKSLKNCSDSIGNRTRDLPACRTVHQPTAPPRTPFVYVMLSRNFRNVCLTRTPLHAVGPYTKVTFQNDRHYTSSKPYKFIGLSWLLMELGFKFHVNTRQGLLSLRRR